MELSSYLDTVREQVAHASALADEQTQHVARQLSASLDSALRLSLIQALSDAASEISAELAPTSVELRMVGSDPEFVVQAAAPPSEYASDDDDLDPQPTEEDDTVLDDEPQARISLRLPASVKKRIDDVAAHEQISTNAWITRTVMNQLRRADRGPRDGRGPREGRGRGQREGRRGGGRRRGGRGWNGPGWSGAMGPGGPFAEGGPGGPFGPGGAKSATESPFPPGSPRTGGWGQQQRGYRGWV